MSQSTPGPRPVPPPADPLADRNYRIRGLKVKLVVDVYDDKGMRIDSGDTEDINVTEAEISTELAELLARKTSMRKGFAALTMAAPVAPSVPTPPAQ